MSEIIRTTSFIRCWRRSGLTEVYCSLLKKLFRTVMLTLKLTWKADELWMSFISILFAAPLP